MMAAEETGEKSFEALVREAPEAPATGTVSLVGTLARSGEAGQFVLTLQDGSAVTMETAAVKGHAVLGVSFGQTIVRVDIDTRKIPTITPSPARWDNPNPLPWFRENPQPVPWPPTQGGVVPFALATAQQAPPALFEALHFHPIITGSLYDLPRSGIIDPGTGVADPGTGVADPGTGFADVPSMTGPTDRI
jgi:hypothetical protein